MLMNQLAEVLRPERMQTHIMDPFARRQYINVQHGIDEGSKEQMEVIGVRICYLNEGAG